MSRQQEHTIERLALTHGSLAIREGYEDRHVEATTRRGQSWRIAENGQPVEQAPDFSVRWD